MIFSRITSKAQTTIPRAIRAALGLPAPSRIRTAKIATIDAAGAEPIGRLDLERLAAVRTAIARHLRAERNG